MPSLLLPRHVKHSVMRDKVRQNMAAKPEPMKHRINTDDFVSVGEILEQVERYRAYDGVMPNPAGWTVMVLMLTIPDVTEGGVIMDEEYANLRTKASPQGIVVGIGSAAYNPEDERFWNGPWCKVGDRVLYGRYAGKGFTLANGQELAFLSDTDIIATVESGWLDAEVENDEVS